MYKNVVAVMTVVVVSYLPIGASAQDATTNPVAEQVQDSADTANVASYISAICATSAVMSEKAQSACQGNVDNMPTMLKDGSRLSNRGVGSEFNALIANIAAFS